MGMIQVTQARNVEVSAEEFAILRQIYSIQQHAASPPLFFPLARQSLDRSIEIGRHHFLHGVAIETDQPTHEGDGQQILAALSFLFRDDMPENRPSDIVAGSRIVNDEIVTTFRHAREAFEIFVGAGLCVVETPITVFLDNDCVYSLHHRSSHAADSLIETARSDSASSEQSSI